MVGPDRSANQKVCTRDRRRLVRGLGGVRSGHCNREEIGAVLGGVVDGAVGALIPGSNSRTKVGVCCDFTLYGSRGEDRWNRKGRACQSNPGVWKIM